jgi:hypothetical protein
VQGAIVCQRNPPGHFVSRLRGRRRPAHQQ